MLFIISYYFLYEFVRITHTHYYCYRLRISCSQFLFFIIFLLLQNDLISFIICGNKCVLADTIWHLQKKMVTTTNNVRKELKQKKTTNIYRLHYQERILDSIFTIFAIFSEFINCRCSISIILLDVYQAFAMRFFNLSLLIKFKLNWKSTRFLCNY